MRPADHPLTGDPRCIGTYGRFHSEFPAGMSLEDKLAWMRAQPRRYKLNGFRMREAARKMVETKRQMEATR